ncbi:MAG TPA: glycosyltransferase, partial [Longimicrobium sp.]
MTGGPRVSIVVNNYNYGRFLAEAIDSALAQTYPGVEVVVVDDGSTDDSREVIARYADRVLPVLKENGGQASAFNAGFARSSGDIVFFLDADDVLLPEAVAEVVAAWHPGAAKAQFRLRVLGADGQPRDETVPAAALPLPSGDVREGILRRGEYVFPPTSGNAFRRDALEQVIPMPEAEWRISADLPLLLVVPLFGDVVSIDRVLGFYRVHGGNAFSYDRPDVARLAQRVEMGFRKQRVVMEHGGKLGLRASPTLAVSNPYFLVGCMTLKLMSPAHPSLERLPFRSLAWEGLRALWSYPTMTLRQRLLLSPVLALSPFVPRPLARTCALWWTYPAVRPRVL